MKARQLGSRHRALASGTPVALALGVRSAILVASLLATRVAAADDTRAELSAVGGSLYPLGAFIEQRMCTLDRKPFIGCAHLAIGHQLTPADPMGHTVLDFSGSSGVQFERGRISPHCWESPRCLRSSASPI